MVVASPANLCASLVKFQELTPSPFPPPAEPLTYETESHTIEPVPDEHTGAPTRLRGGPVGRLTAGRIGEDAEGQSRRGQTLVEDLDSSGAVGRPPRQISPAAWSEALGQPQLSDEVIDRIAGLKSLGSAGSEGFATTDGKSAYKIYGPRTDEAGAGIGLIAHLVPTATGEPKLE